MFSYWFVQPKPRNVRMSQGTNKSTKKTCTWAPFLGVCLILSLGTQIFTPLFFETCKHRRAQCFFLEVDVSLTFRKLQFHDVCQHLYCFTIFEVSKKTTTFPTLLVGCFRTFGATWSCSKVWDITIESAFSPSRNFQGIILKLAFLKLAHGLHLGPQLGVCLSF